MVTSDGQRKIGRPVRMLLSFNTKWCLSITLALFEFANGVSVQLFLAVFLQAVKLVVLLSTLRFEINFAFDFHLDSLSLEED